MGLFSVLLDLLYPPRCVFCRGLVPGGETVCAACRETLPYARGGGKHGEFFGICVAPLYYEGDVRASLHRYKFGGCSHYAETYAAMMAECVKDRLDGEFDRITWTPLSRKRLRERGYDQARLLAEALAERLDCPVLPTLEKWRDTPKQSAAGAADKRRANIAGAYRAAGLERVAGGRFLLVDDIVTTGSTLSECARTLRASGARSVVCAAAAQTRD